MCSVCLVRLRDNGCREEDHEDGDDDEDDSGRGFPLLSGRCCNGGWKVDDMKYDMGNVNKRKPIFTWQVTYLWPLYSSKEIAVLFENGACNLSTRNGNHMTCKRHEICFAVFWYFFENSKSNK